jgi:transcriptional regulator with XRE-family HTH domain
MIQNETFGEFVKRNREKLGMGSRSLSKLVNKGASYISQIENGRNQNPDYRVACALMHIFKIDADEIESTLNTFGINEPENYQKTNMQYFRKSIEEIYNDFSKEEVNPTQINFIEKMDDKERNLFESKIKEIFKMLYVDLDFNPELGGEIINQVHESVLKKTNEILTQKLKEIFLSLDIAQTLSLTSQFKEEINRRGLGELLLTKQKKEE